MHVLNSQIHLVRQSLLQRDISFQFSKRVAVLTQIHKRTQYGQNATFGFLIGRQLVVCSSSIITFLGGQKQSPASEFQAK